MRFPAPIGLWKRLFPGNSEVPAAPDSGTSPGSPLARLLQTFVNTLTSEERKAMLKAHPKLLSSQADKILAHSASLAPNERDRQRLQQCRAFLELCRKIGIDAAFTPVPETPPGTPLGFVLQALINAPTLTQKKAIIQAHPELLSSNLEASLPRAAGRAWYTRHHARARLASSGCSCQPQFVASKNSRPDGRSCRARVIAYSV